MKFLKQHPKVIILAILLANLMQCFWMELTFDEAYYYYYSQHLSWGYFDHPPMIALLIHLGESLFHHPLAVRLLPAFMWMGTVFFCYKIYETIFGKQTLVDLLFFYGIAFILPGIHLFSFIATPDAPLLFWSALFLWIYFVYKKNPKPLYMLCLGLVAAAMLYSKYHGILLLIFLFFSEKKNFSKPLFYVIASIALVCFSPHLFWQYQHHFPSIRYHFLERNSVFGWDQVFAFFINQFLFFNPLILILCLWLIWKKQLNFFEENKLKSLLFIFFAILLFFTTNSFRGYVEPHWTLLAEIPFLIFLFHASKTNPIFKNYLQKIIFLSVVILVGIRVFLVWQNSFIPLEVYGNKNWISQIKKIAGTKPVLFMNSYQDASMYRFYAQQEAYSANFINGRRNEYDMADDWKYKLYGKPILVVSNYVFESYHPIGTQKDGSRMLGDTIIYFLPQFLHFSIPENLEMDSLQNAKIVAHISAKYPMTLGKEMNEFEFSIAEVKEKKITHRFPVLVNLKNNIIDQETVTIGLSAIDKNILGKDVCVIVKYKNYEFFASNQFRIKLKSN